MLVVPPLGVALVLFPLPLVEVPGSLEDGKGCGSGNSLTTIFFPTALAIPIPVAIIIFFPIYLVLNQIKLEIPIPINTENK